MQISVTLPVYNAAATLEQAVESALTQPETAEVVLIEDGSTDGSLAACEALAARHPDRVRLIRHPGGENRGPGASRNAGILHSQWEIIAFLDADDFYLPGRFLAARAILEAQPEVDGVYEAVGLHFEHEAARQRWLAQTWNPPDKMTVERWIEPGDLLAAFATGYGGTFHLNGLTMRRRAFERAGLFDQGLRIGQDNALRIRLAAACCLAPGASRAPVAMMRVHDNRVSGRVRGLKERYLIAKQLGKTLRGWARGNLNSARRTLVEVFIARRLAQAVAYDPRWPVPVAQVLKRAFLAIYALGYPRFFVTFAFWQTLFPFASLIRLMRAALPGFLWQNRWIAGQAMPPERVIMFHVGRSGSTVLGDLLDQHPEIDWRGEAIYHLLGPLRRRRLLRWMPRLSAARLLRESMAGCHRRFYGCEVKFFHLDQIGNTLPQFIEVLDRLGFRRFIILERRNTLRKVVSSLVAQKRETYRQAAYQSASLTQVTLDPARVPIDGGEAPLLALLRGYSENMRWLRELLAGRSVLELAYEEDIQANPTAAYQRVCAYLGVEPAPAFVRYGRSNPFRLDEIIENYGEVQAALRGTEFEWMLEAASDPVPPREPVS